MDLGQRYDRSVLSACDLRVTVRPFRNSRFLTPEQRCDRWGEGSTGRKRTVQPFVETRNGARATVGPFVEMWKGAWATVRAFVEMRKGARVTVRAFVEMWKGAWATVRAFVEMRKGARELQSTLHRRSAALAVSRGLGEPRTSAVHVIADTELRFLRQSIGFECPATLRPPARSPGPARWRYFP